MSFKVMKATMGHHHRLFHCQHLHHVHHLNKRSPSNEMKTKSFSIVASISKSIHKCQSHVIQFFSKLASPKQHQSVMLIKQEEEPNINSLQPNVSPKLKLKSDAGFSVPQVSVLRKQKQHQYLLPPSVSTKRRTIVLDLDETLVHSMTEPPPLNYDFTIEPVINGVTMNFYVLKRPGVDEFLEAISKQYEIVVFTAGLEPYASLLLDVLDPKGLISHRLYRDSCKQITKRRFVKDLSMIGRELGNVLIIDDNPGSYALQPSNGIPIKRFIDDIEDDELGKLLKFFERDCDGFEDMRDVVKEYFGGDITIGELDQDSYKINHHPRKSQKLGKFTSYKLSQTMEILHEYSMKLPVIVEVLLKAMARSLNLEENQFLQQYGDQATMQARFNFYFVCSAHKPQSPTPMN